MDVNRAIAVCAKKASYPNEHKARQKAWRLERRHRKPQTPYLCPVCGKWHITTKRDWSE